MKTSDQVMITHRFVEDGAARQTNQPQIFFLPATNTA